MFKIIKALRNLKITALIQILILAVLVPLTANAESTADLQKRANELKSLKWGMFICWSFSTYSGHEWSPDIQDVAFFRATTVDTDEWARTAKEAGMGYILFLTKHHDGFCLWNTATTDRKVTNAPLGCDVLAELRKSCDKYGIKLALYFSEGDWTWPNKPAGKRLSSGINPEMKKAQLRELLTNYGPIEFIWFDHATGDGGLNHADTDALVHSIQPDCLVGFNNGEKAGQVRSGEMAKPGPLHDQHYLVAEFTYPIQPHREKGAHWFYSLPEYEDVVYPAEKIYSDYTAGVAAGNIFSLDVGPDYNGHLRKVDVEVLRKVGEMIRGK
jgi:alpha-L-fucosidase